MRATKEINALLESAIPRNSADFEAAESALARIGERTNAKPEFILQTLRESSAADASYEITERLVGVRRRLKENEKEIGECEKKFVEVQQNSERMANAQGREEAALAAKIAEGMHRRLISMYYAWKVSGLQERITGLGEENRQLTSEEARLVLQLDIMREFGNMLRDSALGAEKNRKGAALIAKSLKQ